MSPPTASLNLSGQSPLRVYLPGKGEVTLAQTDYLATGGEGSLYAKGGYVYKLYLDPAAARARGIEAKLSLLKTLRHPHIVAPIDVLHDAQHEVVGFYMPQASGVPLVKTFHQRVARPEQLWH
jgi:DNA-binding helix-hairpin-helix protein with protein kinase domain